MNHCFLQLLVLEIIGFLYVICVCEKVVILSKMYLQKLTLTYCFHLCCSQIESFACFISSRFQGKTLSGKPYKPLFPYFEKVKNFLFI